MEVTLAVLADYANVTKEGKLNVMGLFTHINARVLPYVHPKFPELRATVTRSRSLAKGYIDHALDVAERLEELEAKHGKQG